MLKKTRVRESRNSVDMKTSTVGIRHWNRVDESYVKLKRLHHAVQSRTTNCHHQSVRPLAIVSNDKNSQNEFTNAFPNVSPPSKTAIFRLNKKFDETGSVSNAKHGRVRTVLTPNGWRTAGNESFQIALRTNFASFRNCFPPIVAAVSTIARGTARSHGTTLGVSITCFLVTKLGFR